MLTPTQVWRRVRDLPNVTKTGLPPPNIHGYGECTIGQKEVSFGIFLIGKIICCDTILMLCT